MTRLVAIVSIAFSFFAAPALAEEAPAYKGDYQPPVTRDGSQATEFVGAHAIAATTPRVSANPDPALQNYSANVTHSDLRSGK